MGGEGRPWEHHEEGLDLSLKEPNRLPGEDDIKAETPWMGRH